MLVYLLLHIFLMKYWYWYFSELLPKVPSIGCFSSNIAFPLLCFSHLISSAFLLFYELYYLTFLFSITADNLTQLFFIFSCYFSLMINGSSWYPIFCPFWFCFLLILINCFILTFNAIYVLSTSHALIWFLFS